MPIIVNRLVDVHEVLNFYHQVLNSIEIATCIQLVEFKWKTRISLAVQAWDEVWTGRKFPNPSNRFGPGLAAIWSSAFYSGREQILPFLVEYGTMPYKDKDLSCQPPQPQHALKHASVLIYMPHSSVRLNYRDAQ
jgi:hypothetical protein